MSNTMRILLAVALAVIIIGVVVAFVLPNINPPAAQDTTDNNTNNNNPPRNQGGPTNTPAPTVTPIPTVRLVVAVNNLPRGFKIPPNDAVAIAQWPIDVSDIPPGAIDDLELVIGKIARTDIVPGQPILRSMLAEDLSDLASFGSDAAAVLPQNNVAVAVPMDRITSVAYAIQPGDHVDVIVSLLFVDVDPRYTNLLNLIKRFCACSIQIQTPAHFVPSKNPFRVAQMSSPYRVSAQFQHLSLRLKRNVRDSRRNVPFKMRSWCM